MGQYYKPLILEDKVEGQPEKVKVWMYSHDYGSGLKLMEHSWMKNDFVQTFERLLSRTGGHYKSRVVWAGDYADEENFTMVDDEGTTYQPNLYSLCDDKKQINPKVQKTIEFPFLVNHTKKVFVDKTKIPADVDGWRIHPLPLLTCEGNGRGGGDYRGEDKNDIIGSWARDVISLEKENPKVMLGTMDFEEMEFNLVEE